MVQRGLFCAASTVIVCAIGAALLQLAVMILSFSSPGRDYRDHPDGSRPAQFAAPAHTRCQAPIRPQKSAWHSSLSQHCEPDWPDEIPRSPATREFFRAALLLGLVAPKPQ